MMNIKAVSVNEAEHIYNIYIVPYFHEDELKPISIIKELMERNLYRIYVLTEVEQIIGAALVTFAQESGAALLDYFAIVPECRGKGYGSLMLKYLRECHNEKGLVIETEALTMAGDKEELYQRTKRNAFYEKNGARKTQYQACIWNCIYDLWIVGNDSINDEDVLSNYDRIYKSMIPEEMYITNCLIPYEG